MIQSNYLQVRLRAIWGLHCLAALLYCTSVFAVDGAYVMSLPYAISEENIYKVRIEKIDGQDQKPATRYPVSTGKHIVTVTLMLNVYWTPNLTGSKKTNNTKTFDLAIEDGMTYQVGAKVDVDAPIESQLDGSFWEPILYKAYKH
jgi:hypothetical protein